MSVVSLFFVPTDFVYLLPSALTGGDQGWIVFPPNRLELYEYCSVLLDCSLFNLTVSLGGAVRVTVQTCPFSNSTRFWMSSICLLLLVRHPGKCLD